MAIHLANNPHLCLQGRSYPTDPVIIVVCPTNRIEEQMAEKMRKLGLDTLAINAITVHNARLKNEDLWAKARTGISMLMMSSEQLIGKPCSDLLNNSAFWQRVVGLGIDELHLLSWWGKSFRKAFMQIGLMCARLPADVVVIGTSATIAVGKPYEDICKFLELQEGQFHCIRWSNFRPGLQLLLCYLESGINGRRFPALLWILESNRKTVIYCATISLTFRVTCYLWVFATDKSNLSTRIHMYMALNWPSYNEATRKILYDNPSANITIATAAMAEGIDTPDIQDVVIVGKVSDPDEAHQCWGRAGRDWAKVKDARGIMYLTGSVNKKADAILKGAQNMLEGEGVDIQKSKSKRKGPEMSLGMAQMICAPCLTAKQDRYYGNPPANPACSCETCSISPPPSRRPTCNCSHCVPEMLAPIPKPLSSVPAGLVGKPICSDLKGEARTRLLALRAAIWWEASEHDHGSIPMVAFLPDSIITSIINSFTSLTSPDTLNTLIASKRYLQPHAACLWSVICEIRLLEDTLTPAQAPSKTSDNNNGIHNATEDTMEVDSLVTARVSSDEAASAGTPPTVLAIEPGLGSPAHQLTVEPESTRQATSSRTQVRGTGTEIPEHMIVSWQLNTSLLNLANISFAIFITITITLILDFHAVEVDFQFPIYHAFESASQRASRQRCFKVRLQFDKHICS
ncbi:hypothetical protein EWM64_g9127 [Hericium alpestre]|uniref:DNA 3'-5' helicase n=1 Tax=Hericium alpestre TaxID=135208 RepID=A0A4Y9ZJB0_9AGAM|nr:hypothetical protein EWM64_g9127 [Hericium alpestre]